MIDHPLPKDVREKLFALRQRDEATQKRIRLGKTPYTHKREHKTLDNWIE